MGDVGTGGAAAILRVPPPEPATAKGFGCIVVQMSMPQYAPAGCGGPVPCIHRESRR